MKTIDRIKEFKFVQNSLKNTDTPFGLYKVECDEGWCDLIYTLCKDLNDSNFKGTVTQIKEKFGGLRFYVDGGTEKIHKLTGIAENDSFKICEVCGKSGKCISKSGWLMTGCKKHLK